MPFVPFVPVAEIAEIVDRVFDVSQSPRDLVAIPASPCLVPVYGNYAAVSVPRRPRCRASSSSAGSLTGWTRKRLSFACGVQS